MKFIRHTVIPKGAKQHKGLHLVCADRSQKTYSRRVWFTVGGNKVEYPFDVSMKTAGLTTAKILFNSVLSTPGAKFRTTDIKDLELPKHTHGTHGVNTHIPVSAIIPDDIMLQYTT
jgi:hypothetical protein